MAKIETLRDRISGTTVYPITSSEAVIDPQGRDLETRFAAERSRTDSDLKNYALKQEVADGLATKQDALAVTEDLSLNENVMGLSKKGRLAELIRRWNEAWWLNPRLPKTRFGQYNEQTKFFEGNGVLDITEAQARRILEIGWIVPGYRNAKGYPRTAYGVPTVLPIVGFLDINLNDVLPMGTDLKTVRIVDYYMVNNGADPETSATVVYDSRSFLTYVVYIRDIQGLLDLRSDQAPEHFQGSFVYGNLETLWIKNMIKDIDLHAHRNFSSECVAYMVENAANKSPVTITLHPQAYARITDDIFAMAAEKDITIATISS